LAVRKSDGKLQLILERAAEVFASKGFEGSSVRDLSRATGISLAGLYHYFDSKQQLLHRIQMDAFTRILEQLEQRLEDVRDPEERVRALIRNHLDYFLAHPLEMKVFTHEAEALEEPFRSDVVGIKRRYYELALRLFRELGKSGRARPVSPRAAVLALFGMMNWIYTWHRPGTDPGSEQLAADFAEIFLRGVLAGESSARRTGNGKSKREGNRDGHTRSS
jgi:AcrR family transcriptional regulator